MSKQTEEIKSALEGLAGDRDTYIHNNAKIQRNAITWLSQLLEEREVMVEALKDAHKLLKNGAIHEYEETVHCCMTKLFYAIEQVGESHE